MQADRADHHTSYGIRGAYQPAGRAATTLLAVLMLVAGALIAPSSPAQDQPQDAANAPAGKSALLRLGNPGEPETLDPHRYNLRLEETILTDLFLGLTTFDAEGRTVPGAASDWEVSDDGLHWVFHLRPGLRWSDGAPLTAADFVFAFRRLLDPRTAASLAYFMYPLRNAAAINAGQLAPESLGAHARDEHTLELELERPYPYLPERLLYPTGYPVPAHVIAVHGDNWVKPEHWVSNGAYRLVEWQPQGRIVLARNDHFADSGLTAAAIPVVHYLPIANEQNAYNRYRAGELDAISSFPSGELAEVRENLAEHLRLSPLLSIMYLVYNVREAPFSDARVREALALAVDRETLTGAVQRADNLPSASFVPALVTDYQPVPMPGAMLPINERRARARMLLEQAGYSSARPLRITLRYISGAETKRTALAIAAFWKQIGVQTELYQAELKAHFADLRQGRFEVAVAGWFGESNPEHYLGLWASGTGDVNYGDYRDAAFDQAFAAAQSEPDLATRNTAMAAAERIGAAGFPVVPLNAVTIRRLVNPTLDGWVENPRDVHPARLLRFR